MKPTILIIDDEDSIREFYILGLKERGFLVLSAVNGLDGFKIAETQRPDVVVLDIVMPGLNGFEVCAKIREIPELSKTAVVFTSAKSYKSDIDKAMELGADVYLIKPFEMNDLIRAIEDVYRKKNPGVS
jgi:two-component system alkaline phosphatase synthesis response regulator PhoP